MKYVAFIITIIIGLIQMFCCSVVCFFPFIFMFGLEKASEFMDNQVLSYKKLFENFW